MVVFRIHFHDFLQNLACSDLHNLYTGFIETVYLLYKDHTVSVCRYPNSGNPYHPSTATGLGPLGLPLAAMVPLGALGLSWALVGLTGPIGSTGKFFLYGEAAFRI